MGMAAYHSARWGLTPHNLFRPPVLPRRPLLYLELRGRSTGPTIGDNTRGFGPDGSTVVLDHRLTRPSASRAEMHAGRRGERDSTPNVQFSPQRLAFGCVIGTRTSQTSSRLLLRPASTPDHHQRRDP